MLEISITAGWLHELLGVDHRRRTEFFREADLILLAQLLIAQQNDEVLVPGVADLREGAIVDLLPEIDADDLGAQGRRQRSHGECRRTRLRLDMSGPRFHPRHSNWLPMPRPAASGAARFTAGLWAAPQRPLKAPWRRPG
jgi:hypothetical protein